MSRSNFRLATGVVVLCLGSGCQSPFYADRGALVGGLGGAGVGALVGNAVDNTPAGAVIGAGVGALAGGAVGSGLDEIEAKNRAMIEAQMARPVPHGAVGFDDVVAMTQASVDEELIINHIQANGVAQSPTSNDLIMLQRSGVSKRVVGAMQNWRPAERVALSERGPPVIVEEHVYGPGWGPPPPYCYRPRPAYGWGFAYQRGF